MLFAGMLPQICTSRSSSGYGSGRNNIVFTTLKMAVFAPIPSASATIATTVTPR